MNQRNGLATVGSLTFLALSAATIAKIAQVAHVKAEDPWTESRIVFTPVPLDCSPSGIAAMPYDRKLQVARQKAGAGRELRLKQDQGGAEGEYFCADAAYDAAKLEAEKFPDNDPRRLDLLNELAYYKYQERFKYDEALGFFTELAKRREAAMGPGSPELANDLNKLGNVYAFLRRDAEAEIHFKRAVYIMEKLPPPDHPYKAIVKHDYAVFLRAHNRGPEADAVEK